MTVLLIALVLVGLYCVVVEILYLRQQVRDLDQRHRSERLRRRIAQYEGSPVRLGLRTRWDV